MFLLIAIMDLILNYVICGNVKSLPNRESFSSPKFQLDRNLESCNEYCMMNENFHIWEIQTNSLTKCQLKDQEIEYTRSYVDQVYHKSDKDIRHDLLKFSKYGYTYKIEYNSELTEIVSINNRTNKKNQEGRKIKVSPF